MIKEKFKLSLLIPCFLCAGMLVSCGSVENEDEAHYRMAMENSRAVNEGFQRCLAYTYGWLEYADSLTGLFPQNLYEACDTWNAHNAAADNYPFMVLTAMLLDKELYRTGMHQMLETERRLTSRIGSLPDDYSLNTQRFMRERIDTAKIIFGSSEYIKDGLIPLTEFAGPSPWNDRMLEMLEDLASVIRVADHMETGKHWSRVEDEINGELLQTLSRVYWMTSDQSYLDWAMDIADHYLLDQEFHRAERIRLRDHGCEIIAGLSEIYFAMHYQFPQIKETYRAPLHQLLDRILECGRNEHGMFFNEVNLSTGDILDSGLVDNWGYLYNAYYTLYLLDQHEPYREAVLLPFPFLNSHYRNYNWERGSADGFADAIEGGINLYHREPEALLKEWIDHEINILWSLQDSSYQERGQAWKGKGVIEGWHGDGNFARTSIMYCLWKTGGTRIDPWRDDVLFGGAIRDSCLYISMKSSHDWEGKLHFDFQRHQLYLNLPWDYPRINQFPEWFPIEMDRSYRVTSGESIILEGRMLLEGIRISLEKEGKFLKIEAL